MHLIKADARQSPWLRAVIATLVVAIVFIMVPSTALAQERGEGEARNKVSHGLEGDGTDDDKKNAQKTIFDTLKDLSNGGQVDGANLDVLNGLGGATDIDSGQLEQLLGGQNRGLFKKILENKDLMETIRQQSPTGGSFLEDVVAPIIGEFEGGGADGLQGAINFVLGSPTGGKYTLQGGYTYSDLLPSVFYSKKQNSDGVVNSLQIGMGELSKYPAGDKETYGQMASPDEKATDTEAGSALTKYVAGLYDFDWLVTVDNSGKSYSPVGDTFNGDTNVMGIGLGAGVFGAKVYEMATRVITWLSDAFKTINLPTLLGLTDTGDADNWLTNTTRNVLNKMGLTKSSVKSIQFLLMTVIGGAFLIVLMYAMRRPDRGSVNDPRAKALGVRVVMVVIAIPFISIFTGVVNNLTEFGAKETYNDAAKINSAYVVDTLNWAAVTNLSLSDAGYGAPTGGGSWEMYKPTSGSVEKLMNSVDARGVSTGIVNKEDTDRTATDLMEALKSGERTNVNSYLRALSGGQSYSFTNGLKSARSQIAAASVPRRGESISSANHKNLSKGGANRMIAPYFLSDRATDDKSDSGSSGSSSDDKKDDKGGDKKDDKGGNKTEGAKDAGAHSKNTLFGANSKGKKYECNTGAMSCSAVKWNTPSTYIYGADTPNYNSRSYRNFTGEVHDQNVQANDPGSGEPSEDSVLEANAVSIAMMNRYGGISNVNGVPSLSTQSVAFLLQSTYDRGTLRFNGYNTAAEGASGAKNNGAHGTEFLRYTMPNTGKADLMGKISALAIVWLTSGIIAIVAMFALFRAPLLLAFLNMFRGLFGAMTGKISGILTYASYYMALRCAFMFVGAAITLGAHVASWLVNLTGVNNTLGGVTDSIRGEQSDNKLFGEVINNVRELFAGAVSSLATVFVCLLLCAILCWPIFTVPRHNGQVKKLSLVSSIVVLPFLIADMASDWIDNIARKVGEKPMKTEGVYAGRATKINQKEQLLATGKRAGHVARDAGAIGLAGVTGGATAVGSKLAKSAVTKSKSDKVNAGRDGKGLAQGVGTAVETGTAFATGGVGGAVGSVVGNAVTGAAGRTVSGASGSAYSPTLPNSGVRSGGAVNSGYDAIPVNSDGEVLVPRDVGASTANGVSGGSLQPTGAAIQPMSSSMPVLRSELTPATLAALAAIMSAGAVAGGRSGNSRIDRVDRADIGSANIAGGVRTDDNLPSERDGGAQSGSRDYVERRGNESVNEPSRHGGAGSVEQPEEPKRGWVRRTAGVARDVTMTGGAVAYGAFDQGSALEKHMERMANRVTGTTAQDRRLPFEKQRESRLDTLRNERTSGNTGGNNRSVDSGFTKQMEQLRKENERSVRETQRLTRHMERTERELRRNTDHLRRRD